jgi:hypothetical protein
MTFLKTAGLLILAFLFITSCAILTSTSQRQLHEPEAIKTPGTPAPNFYVKHECWKSPFNPHEVLQYWVKLGARQINESVAVALVGNPKIDWEQYRASGAKLTEAAIPPGEIASTVVFVFARTPAGTIELASYGYIDDLGVQRVFALNLETKCYEKYLIPKQQQSCSDDYLKAAFNVYQTY